VAEAIDSEGPPGSAAAGVVSVAGPLLRLGINRRGRLDANRLWDVALRCAIVVDLMLSDVIGAGDGPGTLFIDTAPTGVGFLDLGVAQLLSTNTMTLDRWITRGSLKSVDVAGYFVESDGWAVRPCLTCASRRVYVTRAARYALLEERANQIAREVTTPASDQMKVVVALASALRLLAGDLKARELLVDGLSSDIVHAVSLACGEIYSRSAIANLGSQTAGG
jgi:hypothetical protein